MNSISKYFFKTTLIVLVGLMGSSCSLEYLRPSLPGKIPVVETLPNQNLVFVNKVQFKGRCYSVERLNEVGFLVSSNSGIIENGPGVEKIILNISDSLFTNQNEYFFDTEHSVGSVPGHTNYYRAFCKNSLGIGYGDELYFTLISTSIPTVLTSSISQITSSGAVSGGNAISDGGSSVTAKGVAYDTSQNPNTANNVSSNGSGLGLFTCTLTGLMASTSYYVRAYATNSLGTGYGSQMSFTTSPACFGSPTVTDVNGNSYNTIQIGKQCWTKSNLIASKYRNGDNIPSGLSSSAWQNTTSGAYAIYNNDTVNDGLYGKLYNHYAVTDSRGLCPTGWHVPSDVEWTTLENQLGGASVAGGALKSTAIQPASGGWYSPNTGATNSSGFTALPGGLRDLNGDFGNMANIGYWWSSSVWSGSNAWTRSMYYDDILNFRYDFYPTNGFSIRCLRD